MSTPKQNLVNSASLATNSENVMHLPGSIINDRYQIIQKLGKSEREKTYLAKDLQATVDVKCIVEQLDFNHENEANWRIIQQYLLNEVTILKRLGDHPQIPQLYAHVWENQQFYLIREYIDGDSLEQEVERKKFDEAETIYLIQDGLRILDFIHKTNVIHHNVQPVHLIRRKEDSAYVLINFGAIRELEATEINLQGKLILNNAGRNWVYGAPEQKIGESTFSSDIYALARCAIYALTGRSPLELEQTNVDWRSQCQISLKLEAILTKMMSPIVHQRYRSALEVLQDLRPLLKIKQLVGGRYSITKYLGGKEGTETYLADNLRRQYQSPCLVKQLELPHSDDDGKIQLERRFAEELSVLERLGYHEQIPQLWDHFEENDQFYLVQEYIQGENLAQKIAQQELSIAQIVQILDSTLSVLQVIHQNRVIHCNIKPSNLIIRESDQQVIITDFGILNEIKTKPNISEDSQNFDRQNYWSPEQIAGRPTISSDLYAVGMTMIEALTGTKPATFSREQTGKLLWTENVSLDRRLIRIIDKLVQLDLGQRYQSAEKVINDLRKVSNYGSLNYQSLDLVPVLQDSQTEHQRKRLFIPLLIGLFGVIFLLGSIEFAFPRLRPIYYWYQGEKLLPDEPQTALDTFTKAIDLQAKSWRAWSGRGDSLFLMERYPQALGAYVEATELNPRDAENWKKRGDVLFRLENFTEAISAYNQALKLEPEKAEIYNRKGQALFQLQQYEAAKLMQDAALERDQFNAQFLSDRAHILLQLGRYDDALGLFNRVQVIEPTNLKLWQNKFLVLEKLGRPQEAAKVKREISNQYLKKIQQQPQDISTWIAQGDFFVSAQMYAKAIDAYDQAIKLKPNGYEAWLGKGKALAQLGQRETALAALDRALQIRPQLAQAWQQKGNIQQAQNNFIQAIANYDQAIEINSNLASLWRDRGIALAQQKRYTQAIESLTKASELSTYDVQTWQELANVQSALGQDNQAISAIDRGLKYFPQNADLWSLKGLILTSNGQYNEACETYRLSLKMAVESDTIMSSMKQLGCRLN